MTTHPLRHPAALTCLRLLPLLALGGLMLPGVLSLLDQLPGASETTYIPWLAPLALWLLYRDWPRDAVLPAPRLRAAGLLLLACGGLLLIVGRSQQLELLEFGSIVPLLAGVVHVLGGDFLLRRLRFVLCFLVFLLPYPGWLVDSLTQPLRLALSGAAETIFHALGYPVARSGVLISLGQYRLLVADACSGLHSLIFLSALGLLYCHLTPGRRLWQWVLLVLALLPIALLANLLRVLLLMFITLHWGDAQGQLYWHDVAGLVVFVSAFVLLIATDCVVARAGRAAPPPTAPRPLALASSPPSVGWQHPLGLTLFLALVAALAQAFTPTQLRAPTAGVNLATLIPPNIGAWTLEDDIARWVISPDLAASVDRLYEQTLNRTYRGPDGTRLMLSIAYGSRQLGNALQAHRPEYCYRAQGFEVAEVRTSHLALPGQALKVRRLIAVRPGRSEPVTYWMTVGDHPVVPGIGRKLAQLRYGLRGLVPDGMLVRISVIDANSERAFAVEDRFIAALQRTVPGALGLAGALPSWADQAKISPGQANPPVAGTPVAMALAREAR